jgi:hypothetical protein
MKNKKREGDTGNRSGSPWFSVVLRGSPWFSVKEKNDNIIKIDSKIIINFIK